jgi:hypothetical protein
MRPSARDVLSLSSPSSCLIKWSAQELRCNTSTLLDLQGADAYGTAVIHSGAPSSSAAGASQAGTVVRADSPTPSGGGGGGGYMDAVRMVHDDASGDGGGGGGGGGVSAAASPGSAYMAALANVGDGETPGALRGVPGSGACACSRSCALTCPYSTRFGV